MRSMVYKHMLRQARYLLLLSILPFASIDFTQDFPTPVSSYSRLIELVLDL